jgi:ABC-2 type transport system permease protein
VTRGYLAMTRAELRLFLREPFSIVFVLAFPLMMMLLLSVVFGDDEADAGEVVNGIMIWRGVTPTNYYTAASTASVAAALGLLTQPANLAGYREQGILRRMRASSVPATVVVLTHLSLAVLIVIAGSLVMTAVAWLVFGAMMPVDAIGVLVALVAGALTFGTIGLLLASIVSGIRAAQGIGLLLFISIWLISGTAPPPAVLPETIRDVGAALPLGHLVTAIQDPWFGNGWDLTSLAALVGYGMASGIAALWRFRWD